MNGAESLVFGTLGVTIALFIWDRVRIDLVALMALMVLTLGGVIDAAQAFAGFSNSVVIIIAALFVVGEGLAHTGVAARVARWPAAYIGGSEVMAIVVLMSLAAVLSGLMSSTGAVAVMIPVVMGIARAAKLSPAKLLLPMAFAAQIGGMLTLIGTPPNIIASDAMESTTGSPFSFFAITPFGVAALATGVVFLATVGRALLPKKGARKGTTENLPSMAELARSFGLETSLHRARVPEGSELVGKSLVDNEVRAKHRVNIVQIERMLPGASLGKKPQVIDPQADTILEAGDVLSMRGGARVIAEFERAMMLEPLDHEEGHLDKQIGAETGIVEVVLTPTSRFRGKTLRDVHFRDRFGATVVAIKRRNRLLDGRVSRQKLRFGDSLLVAGPWRKIEELREERRHFIIARETSEMREGLGNHKRAPVAIAIVTGMLAAMTFGWAPVVTVSVLAALAMALSGCVRVEGVYRTINWTSVVLIAAMLPMATALEVSGGLERIVNGLSAMTAGQPAMLALGIVMLATSVLSQVISNTATTVLMAPIGAQMAAQLGIAPGPILMGIAVAASTAFATPVASPVNTLVLGPGEYRFFDYVKVGVPLQMLVLVVAWALIPVFIGF